MNDFITDSEYRIVVEKRPGEDFERFYPEIKRINRWENTQLPIEIRYYKNEIVCRNHIEMLKERDKINNGGYITKIINL